ncbi:metallophosphoesterase [Metabacillus fastidiosus]|uniref:metallophosphoesterase n=1 Tax=Metabacillus fastidiosus TaxID=1458 RepID=UPI003D279928
MERILAISDIHGHGDSLLSLLTYSGYNPNQDRLFLLGDYIGENADNFKTLEIIEELVQKGAVALRGNHEERVIEKNMKNDIFTQRWKPFFSSLPYWYKESDFLFVHAGIRPGIALKDQNFEDFITIREAFYCSSFQHDETIVFGHTPAYRLGTPPGEFWLAENKIGIDTGAGHGYFLSLADLSNRLQYRIPVNKIGFVEKRYF